MRWEEHWPVIVFNAVAWPAFLILAVRDLRRGRRKEK